jgi:hypothetical protein
MLFPSIFYKIPKIFLLLKLAFMSFANSFKKTAILPIGFFAYIYNFMNKNKQTRNFSKRFIYQS